MILGLPIELSHPCPLHNHEVHELIIGINNRSDLITNNKTFPITKAGTCLVRQNTAHGFTLNKKGAKAYLFCFNQKFIDQHLPRGIHEPLRKTLLSEVTASEDPVDSGGTLKLAEQLHTTIRDKKSFFKETAGALLSQLLINHMQHLQLGNVRSLDSSENRIDALLLWLAENIGEKISIDDAAQQLGVSRAVFTRSFRQHTGKSFTEFLAEERINLAVELLESSELSITEIAFQSGYQNMGHFFKQFQQNQNMTPNNYRKLIRDQLVQG